MAAYAALVSVTNIIYQIQHHPHPPISLDHNRVESLTAQIAFLQKFLENHPPTDTDALEGRIADAAYAAEDIIDLHLVDQILPEPRSGGPRSTIDFNRRLDKAMLDFKTIMLEVENVKKKYGIECEPWCEISESSGSVRSRRTSNDAVVVGLDHVRRDIMHELVGGSKCRQIVRIAGMGGIGKTTLARYVYSDSCIKPHFDVLGWATVSQEYDAKEILLDLLVCLNDKGSNESMSKQGLGLMLHKKLVGRRYLIVLDDIWSREAWDKVKGSFPKNSNGSRVMITTRMSSLASELTETRGHAMSLLDEDKSWDLLRQTVFGDEPCQAELEEIGKKIAGNCKGLPLSIVVVGGLLAKSKPTREHWEHKLENLDSIIKYEDDERCTKILQMSYDQLPVHLKPCFLYIGVYTKDCEINISNLKKLWAAEGFLKGMTGKILEQTAQEYFNELVDRNLIYISRRGYGSKIKYCRIHDLLMDLCVREAQKHRFLFVTRFYNSPAPQKISNQ